jgi:hypothetical protein
MNAVELRYKLIQFITNVDESRLKELEAILYDTGEYEITDEQKKILDERLEKHKSNPTAGIRWEDAEAKLIEKYGA